MYTLLIHLPLFQAKQGDYFRGPSALSYCESVKYCKKNGGELAVIRNQEQNTAAADICSVNLNPKSKSGNNDNYKQTDETQRNCKTKKTKKLCRKENDCDWHTKKYAREELPTGCYHEDTVERAEDYKDDMEDHDQYDKAGKNVPCWLGLTEYVGTENTEIDYQLWIWRDGNASTLPKGQVYDNKARTYSLGYMDDMNHTTTFNATDDNTTTLLTKPNNKKGVPLSSYEYDNWQVCLACSDKENSMEPNNYMGCSESHAFMGSDTADLGKWYDVNAHKYVKYLPLCENTTHENPIHDHQCDTTFSYCWYEQCRNTDVGQDDSKCWSKKDLTSPPKCSESATPKYTELEMKYDGEVYVEYTCCDDNDDSGREKHYQISQKCSDDNDDDNDYPRSSNGSGGLGGLIAFLFFAPFVICYLCYAYKQNEKEKKDLKEKEEKDKKENQEKREKQEKQDATRKTEAKVDSSLSADISSKNIPVVNQPLTNEPEDHVHAMLARCLKKDKTFRKHMDTVDRDESGSLSSKEWRILLAKLKKKDHASDSWELTSDIVKLTFKLVLASTGSINNELTYVGLQAWVVAKTESKGDSVLSTDISSWGRNERNSSVVVHPRRYTNRVAL